VFYTFPGSGGGSSSVTNQKLPYGVGRIYFDSDAATGLPTLGGGAVKVYIKRQDGDWSPWQTWTDLATMESNPLLLNFGPGEAEVYVTLTGSTAADLYVEVIPGAAF
jgi:hypothetical protein